MAKPTWDCRRPRIAATVRGASVAARGILGMCLAFAGCGGNQQISTYPVTGKVRYADGSPMQGGTITLHSGESTVPTRGVVEEDGSFTVGTYGVDDGAPAGSYKVALFPELPADFDPDSGRRLPPTIDRKYSDPDTSGVTLEVSADGQNHHDITVERAKR
jgi:hypothetical protein